jgi:hypothetical protein
MHLLHHRGDDDDDDDGDDDGEQCLMLNFSLFFRTQHLWERSS